MLGAALNPSVSLDLSADDGYYGNINDYAASLLGAAATYPAGERMSFITTIREDINTVQTHDPAAQNGLVIFLSYPGLHAKWAHTPEHWLWSHGLRSIARVMSQFTRFMTGVEIHPAAQIGRRLFIDHAMGVVIGETTIVGDDCVLYQGVTLGGTGKECGKRHPTLGDRVSVGTGAKVLGNIHIGDDVKIGGNSVVVKDVPSNSTVVGVPGRVVRRAGCRVLNENMDRREHRESMPDPVQEQSLLNREGIAGNQRRIEELEQRVAELTALVKTLATQGADQERDSSMPPNAPSADNARR